MLHNDYFHKFVKKRLERREKEYTVLHKGCIVRLFKPVNHMNSQPYHGLKALGGGGEKGTTEENPSYTPPHQHVEAGTRHDGDVPHVPVGNKYARQGRGGLIPSYQEFSTYSTIYSHSP